MKNAASLMKNTLILTGSNIALRFCALCFQAYLAKKIGAAQMGIFGIITSVGVVFATISISGVRFSVTRLAAEEVSCGNEYPKSLMQTAFGYAAVFGVLSGVGMYLSAEILSKCYVGDIQAAVALRIMATAMPAIAFSACVEGYFSAKQKVLRLILMQLTSQLLRIFFAVIMFGLFKEKWFFPADVLAGAFFVGEVSFAVGMFVLYFAECHKKKKIASGSHMPRLIKTAAPLAISAYMRTGLSSIGQVIIPAGLKKSGMGSMGAFSAYGIITQMAMPVVMFPVALLSALGEILVPRLTEAQIKNRKTGICYIVNRSLRIGMVFSFGVMGVMLFYSGELGELIYNNSEAGFYIKIFAPLIPVIYIDCVTDGCLKGLGQQVYSMVFNVMEGIINVVLLFVFLPKAAMIAYVAVMYVKECFNASLSLYRLGKVTKVDLNAKAIVTVLSCMAGARVLGEIMAWQMLPVKILAYCVIYIVLLYVTDAVTRTDINWVTSLVCNKKI